MASIFWYDLETFGKNPYYDRIAQFAGLRTDDNFDPVGDPLVLYCRLSPDYLPDPGACMITGITPMNLPENALPENEFILRVLKEFNEPGTCVTGYNSIRFDDEFIRNALYRNFHDPYEREYQNGNSRWDILDLLRTARDLRPEGIIWADHEDGRPDFTLETLAAANGIDHKHAHDALSDVYATIRACKTYSGKAAQAFPLPVQAAQQKRGMEADRSLQAYSIPAYLRHVHLHKGMHNAVSTPDSGPQQRQLCYYF